MHEEKKNIIFELLQEKVNQLLVHIDREDSLDYFKIEISNHNGNLQVDYSFRERVKAY